MALVWLITLTIYGCVAGWDFDPLFWWLLVAMSLQDNYDAQRRKGQQNGPERKNQKAS